MSASDALEKVDRLVSLFGNDTHLVCPHCGHRHALDCEACSAVVSYWGDDLHDFACNMCGKDFVVREIVTRKFEAAKTADDLSY